MMIADLIRAFHAEKKLPVFNLASHGSLLSAQVENFENDGMEALRRFADANGFRAVTSDWELSCKFAPANKPEDYAEWTEAAV